MPIQKSKVTIFDVAKASGVSSSAVSYALNGKSGVSDVTRDKVLKVAHELGWKPNGAAQALAKAKTQRVGLVLGYDPKLLSVESYMMELISGLGAELEKYDYSLLIRMAVGEDAKLSIIDDWIATGNVDAMLLVNVELGDPCVALLEEHEEMPVLAIADASVVGNLPSLSSADADAVRRGCDTCMISGIVRSPASAVPNRLRTRIFAIPPLRTSLPSWACVIVACTPTTRRKPVARPRSACWRSLSIRRRSSTTMM